MTDHRQRHDIPWSQPLPLEPRTLADDPLPAPASDLKEALEYVRACCETGDSVLGALQSAVYVFTPDPEPVAELEPYKPKAGERARLVSSPDPLDNGDRGSFIKVGRPWLILCSEGSGAGEVNGERPGYFWKVRDEVSGSTTYIHRDAVWEPVAAQEPTAEPAQPAERERITTSSQFRDLYPDLWREVYAQGCADGLNRAIANLEKAVRNGR